MCLYPIYLKGLTLPCGNCMECQMQHSLEWAYRCTLESSLYKQNCMLTLTYATENLPENNSVSKRDFQLFMKRLRKFLSPRKIRFFGCGEYGDLKGRPHYHIIIFGYDFEDKYLFFVDKKENNLYRSPTLEKLWTNGLSSIGEVNFNTAKYCTLYLQKKNFRDGRADPFVLMSKGLGFAAFNPKWLDTDKIYLNGKYIKIPRYFLDKMSNSGFKTNVEVLKENRLNNCNLEYKYPVVFSDEEKGIFTDYTFDYDLIKKDLEVRREKFKNIFQKDFYKNRKND